MGPLGQLRVAGRVEVAPHLPDGGGARQASNGMLLARNCPWIVADDTDGPQRLFGPGPMRYALETEAADRMYSPAAPDRLAEDTASGNDARTDWRHLGISGRRVSLGASTSPSHLH